MRRRPRLPVAPRRRTLMFDRLVLVVRWYWVSCCLMAKCGEVESVVMLLLLMVVVTGTGDERGKWDGMIVEVMIRLG